MPFDSARRGGPRGNLRHRHLSRTSISVHSKHLDAYTRSAHQEWIWSYGRPASLYRQKPQPWPGNQVCNGLASRSFECMFNRGIAQTDEHWAHNPDDGDSIAPPATNIARLAKGRRSEFKPRRPMGVWVRVPHRAPDGPLAHWAERRPHKALGMVRFHHGLPNNDFLRSRTARLADFGLPSQQNSR